MNFPAAALIGFFLGFAFGVGCALAVLFSIYMGGYRAAVRDAALAQPPARYIAAQSKLASLKRSEQAAAAAQTAKS